MYIKRTAAALLTLLMLFSVVACANGKTSSPGEGAFSPTASEPKGDQSTPDKTPSVTPDSSPSGSTPSEDPTSGGNDLTVLLSEETKQLYQNSYNILFDRITDRGYAITSLTGTYVGMFTRDSSIQAMAHLSYGDSDSARAILRYLLSYHAALGLKRGTHIIDEVKDEEYRNNYLNGKNEPSVSYYEEQTSPGVAQFLINAPNNASATPFITKKHTVDSVQAYLEGAVGASVVAEIYTDVKDASTLVGKGSYVFDSSVAGFKTIPLEKTVSLTPGATYYLKLYAPNGSGRVVWYGVSSGKSTDLKAWNYDRNAYGGDGWREVGVYTAFIIGESDNKVTSNYQIAQRNGETGIYVVNAPNNGAAQPFVPKNDRVYSVDLHLNKSGDGDTVTVSIMTDYKNEDTTLATATYTFGSNPSGWQNIAFDTPVSVTPGATYYLKVQATANSGRVIWNGTTGGSGSNSFNYDVGALGGWSEKPYHLAFEILSFPQTQIAKGFEARGNTVKTVDVTVFSTAAKGKIKVELRSDYTNPASVVGTAEAAIDKTGECVYTVRFPEEVALQYKGYYYVVITLEGTENCARIMSDASAAADTYAFDDGWMRVGYDLLVNAGFEVDKAQVITLDGTTVGVQEIPTAGELITSVKVLLSKAAGATGTVKATLYKGKGTKAQKISSKTVEVSALSEDPALINFLFDLPLTKTQKDGNYYLHLELVEGAGKVYWCGSTSIDNYETYTEKNGVKTTVTGEAGFEALRSRINLISDYTQTDATYMLVHAWAMFVNNNKGTQEDLEFIKESYPIIKSFANYYIDSKDYYNKNMDLLLNPSLEHSRKIRYWVSYDLLTNVFASQALYELSFIAKAQGDSEMEEKWKKVATKIEEGINTHLVTEVDGKKIYGEFYDVEDNMKFYAGISWVNFAPVAAEWYGMDLEIMKNTYEVYKKYASIRMYGQDCLATEATLGTSELTRELIGKGIAWELMFCKMIGDTERMAEIVELELATAEKNKISVYPEFWKSENYVTDPGNQEHCSWQFYAMSIVFPELVEASAK